MRKILIILPFCFFALNCKISDNTTGDETGQMAQNDRLMVMFYNVENYFDTENDSLINDEEFLPESDRRWNYFRYAEKKNKIAKTILAVGGWQSPELVGLCEIENRKALNDLIFDSPLSNAGYYISHFDSPDRRGIDVALLYKKESIEMITERAIRINNPERPRSRTRDVLYFKGLFNNSDTLHIFVNHWPSRYGGQMATEPLRCYVASVVRQKVDSLFDNLENPNVIIMGDLNDEPDNISVAQYLKANTELENIMPEELYDLAAIMQKSGIGSHKYQGRWSLLDHIIVSGNLLKQENTLNTTLENTGVFNAEFLLEDDKSNLGKKPFRTYLGPAYHGGYSDHLPVYAVFE